MGDQMVNKKEALMDSLKGVTLEKQGHVWEWT